MVLKEKNGKLRWSLIFPMIRSIRSCVRILMFGQDVKGYREFGWLLNEPNDYSEARWRHMVAHDSGETYDPETGESHLAHLIVNALFEMELRHEYGGQEAHEPRDTSRDSQDTDRPLRLSSSPPSRPEFDGVQLRKSPVSLTGEAPPLPKLEGDWKDFLRYGEKDIPKQKRGGENW